MRNRSELQIEPPVGYGTPGGASSYDLNVARACEECHLLGWTFVPGDDDDMEGIEEDATQGAIIDCPSCDAFPNPDEARGRAFACLLFYTLPDFGPVSEAVYNEMESFARHVWTVASYKDIHDENGVIVTVEDEDEDEDGYDDTPMDDGFIAEAVSASADGLTLGPDTHPLIRCPHCDETNLDNIDHREFHPSHTPFDIDTADSVIALSSWDSESDSNEAERPSLFCQSCSIAFPIPRALTVRWA